MANHYLDLLAQKMRSFDLAINGKDFGLEMYKAGAWIGLEKTDLWTTGLKQDEKDEIKADQQILYNGRGQCD